MKVHKLFQTYQVCRSLMSRQKPPLHQTTSSYLPQLRYNTTDQVRYTVSHEAYKHVEDILPPSRIPQPPKHEVYPTPSGWVAPADEVPDLPYFVKRTKYHLLPIIEKEKPKGQPVTVVYYIDGDIWALEKELKDLIRPSLEFDPATRVHEVTQSIILKGHHENVIQEFLYEKGF
uniref:Large ribosomal subunit protein mL49 n=1 Tax=Ciona savignyi TaxID=51511 RepID=H2YBH3_CIOSA